MRAHCFAQHEGTVLFGALGHRRSNYHQATLHRCRASLRPSTPTTTWQKRERERCLATETTCLRMCALRRPLRAAWGGQAKWRMKNEECIDYGWAAAKSASLASPLPGHVARGCGENIDSACVAAPTPDRKHEGVAKLTNAKWAFVVVPAWLGRAGLARSRTWRRAGCWSCRRPRTWGC